ncbi:uncharacterized protein [Aegilops tauschii subsp. strangulata]|uniref:uncharacterized protein n=1 Tax=Aegilops tauschii subsp. strangulata TaxID=200361 RepID=UPI003CC87EAC
MYIMDGILVLHEVIHEVKSKRLRAVFLKIDFHKAYDTIHWSFLREVLLKHGFDSHWVARVMQLVTSGRTVVNINGEIGPYFMTGQGVRQGDPISSFLFNLVVDALASILDLAKRAGHIRGICPHLVANRGLTHLQYADDTIMMVEGSDEDIQNLKFLLLCFQEMSGLTINFAKSEVMVLGYSQAEAQRIANRFVMGFYSLHESLYHEVTKLLSRFFWAGENNKQKYHMVKWSEICKPKDQGGLGVISSKRMNIALLSKWLWWIQTDEDGLWLEIIRAKYLREQPLAFAPRSGGSQFWQSVIRLMPLSVAVALADLGATAFRRTFGVVELEQWDELLESLETA